MTDHMSKKIQVSIEEGDVTRFDADVIALKFAQALYGADRAVASALEVTPEQLFQQMPSRWETCIFPTYGKLWAPQVLFTNVPDLYEFDYGEIRRFAGVVLRSLLTLQPGTRHLAMTIHGPGYGLDEGEALRSELLGCIDAVEANEYPPELEKISIVEYNPGRAERLQSVLTGTLPACAIYIPQASTGSAREERNLKIQTESTKKVAGAKPHIFVAMPFSDEMEDIFHFGIQGPVNEAGYLCERLDISIFTGDIMGRARERIESADYVIAEITGNNPNVFLELGYAWGKERPTILLTKNVENLPFDVQGQRCLVYNNIRELEKGLTKFLQGLGQTNENIDIPMDANFSSEVITKELLHLLKEEFQLNWNGTHGFPHWKRVRENGLRLAGENGANTVVVELFAFFHDIKRKNEGGDRHHGKRAAEFVNSLGSQYFNLSEDDRELLKYACACHSEGMVEANITVQTCWDADRLDLGRVGTHPDEKLLCTPAAKQPDVIKWAYERSIS
jgi:hypothetical protein